MLFEHNFYCTSDRSLDIEFLFVELAPSRWRIYILSDIPYGSRSTGATDIHRLVEGDETMKTKIRNFIAVTHGTVNPSRNIHYICWSKDITDLEAAHSVAKAWGEITAHYIKYGGSFPSIQKTLSDRHII